ncbi:MULTISPECIES: hypothetical protein [Methylobacterium]|nr:MULTISPECIES: hypothetical protein [Methylobacterium]MCI9882459.1 hypothetical protein [Methylobacterium goesingense]
MAAREDAGGRWVSDPHVWHIAPITLVLSAALWTLISLVVALCLRMI